MNKENLYKNLANSGEGIENGKEQNVRDASEKGKQELSVFEQIKLGIQQAIEVERTNKK